MSYSIVGPLPIGFEGLLVSQQCEVISSVFIDYGQQMTFEFTNRCNLGSFQVNVYL